MKEHIKKLTSLIICLITIVTLVGCGEKEITGNEWLVKQKDCFEDLQAYTEGMDEVYSLYIAGGISKEDFANEVALLKNQYIILNSFYEQLKEENPIKPESHSFVSKRGTEAIENIFACLEGILNNTLDENGQPYSAEETSYIYLAYRQNLVDYIAEYMTAVIWYDEATGNIDNSVTSQENNDEAVSE